MSYSLIVAFEKSYKIPLRTIYPGDERQKHVTISFCTTWIKVDPVHFNYPGLPGYIWMSANQDAVGFHT